MLMNFKRFFAVIKARNIEFFRDRSSLGWNLLFPILMLAGLSFVFSGDGKAVYKVGVVNIESAQSTFLKIRYVDFIDYKEKSLATLKLEQHAIDFADHQMPAVLSTPWLIWFLEHAARQAMLPLLVLMMAV